MKHQIKVKICGIRNFESAQAAVDAGADFMGFVFVRNSKRFIEKNYAREIRSKIKGKIQIVGVFKNQSLSIINDYIKDVKLDYVQLHGDESPKFCRNVKAKVIKAFSLPSNFNAKEIVEKMREYALDYYLIDRKDQGKGVMISLEKARRLADEFSVIFAGGLKLENVREVIIKVLPFAVDVAGGIETDGYFDKNRVKKFIQIVKSL